MKKIIFLCAALLMLMLTFTGCVEKITEGEVVEKNFTPAHVQPRVIPVIISNGKTTTTTMIPYMYYYPDTWSITIQNWDEKENEILTATYRITEEVYNTVEIGAEFVYDEEFEPDYPEYTRERE